MGESGCVGEGGIVINGEGKLFNWDISIAEGNIMLHWVSTDPMLSNCARIHYQNPVHPPL